MTKAEEAEILKFYAARHAVYADRVRARTGGEVTPPYKLANRAYAWLTSREEWRHVPGAKAEVIAAAAAAVRKARRAR